MKEIQYDYPKYMEQKCECITLWASKNGKAGTILNLLRHIYFDINNKSVVMKIVEDLKNKGIYVSVQHTIYTAGKCWWEKTLVNSAIQVPYSSKLLWQKTFVIS